MADIAMMARLSGASLAAGLPMALLTALLAVGCESGARLPKEPVWGKQPCEECAMLLSDRRHGAQLVTADHERLYFDDLGCMVAWTRAHPEPLLGQWVRTADDGQWLAAGQARYRRGERTPMGFGFIAVTNHDALEWSDVTKLVHAKLEHR